ncbi:histidinol-phosphate aminotransferase family protein [Candidatus Nomurabacteria bacterium]|nr:histidinol-phosphate aminotransferase family protein [Candidatus Nomurabacteria bacterium]
MLKLDLNEKPVKIAPGYDYARKEDYARAKKAIANYAAVAPNNLLITNGSYHALDLIFSFLFREKEQILLPVPTFVFYDKFELSRKLIFKKLPYSKSFSSQTIIKHLKSGRNRGLYISNPNNPIGYAFSHSELDSILLCASRNKTLTIVDEAYFEFYGITIKSLIKKYPELIILRTLSKAFGLAGARFGYVIAHEKMIEKLEKLKGPPYIVSHLALKAGIDSLGRVGIKKMNQYVRENQRVRSELEIFLQKQKIEYFSSQTNFLTLGVNDTKKFFESLKRRNILLKDLADYPDGKNCLKSHVRVTIPPSNKLKLIKDSLNSLFP